MAVEGARWSDASLPRNFAPFLAAGTAEALMRIEGAEAPALAGAEPLSTSYNDLGSASLYDAGSAWAVALIPEPGDAPRVMMMRKDFGEAVVYLSDDDPR